MWIIIIALVAVVGFLIFKYFDRDFIKATKVNETQYSLQFENGKNPLCECVDIMKSDENKYYIFIPVESIKNVPLEDVIILKLRKKKDNKRVFVFADKQANGIVLEKLIKRYENNKYGNKYNFTFLAI